MAGRADTLGPRRECLVHVAEFLPAERPPSSYSATHASTLDDSTPNDRTSDCSTQGSTSTTALAGTTSHLPGRHRRVGLQWVPPRACCKCGVSLQIQLDPTLAHDSVYQARSPGESVGRTTNVSELTPQSESKYSGAHEFARTAHGRTPQTWMEAQVPG